MRWVGSDVLEDEGACRGHDEDLEHEVIESLNENLAETLCLERVALVVSEVLASCRESVALDARIQIHFKLVTDAFDTCAQKNFQRYSLPVKVVTSVDTSARAVYVGYLPPCD